MSIKRFIRIGSKLINVDHIVHISLEWQGGVNKAGNKVFDKVAVLSNGESVHLYAKDFDALEMELCEISAEEKK